MNSGCVVVANGQIGAVPFLLKNNQNGSIYYGNDVEKITEIVEKFLNNKELAVEFGRKAYETIIHQWSAQVAADRLVATCKKLLDRKKEFFKDGPCSKASIIVKKE